jgi:hypothetical protein
MTECAYVQTCGRPRDAGIASKSASAMLGRRIMEMILAPSGAAVAL